MSNYKKTKELIERKEKTIAKLIEFFKEEENLIDDKNVDSLIN